MDNVVRNDESAGEKEVLLENSAEITRAYSWKKGHECSFSEKGKKKDKKGKTFKIRPKLYKIWKYFKKGSLMCVIIACMKQLEYALITSRFGKFSHTCQT